MPVCIVSTQSVTVDGELIKAMTPIGCLLYPLWVNFWLRRLLRRRYPMTPSNLQHECQAWPFEISRNLSCR